MEFEKIDVAIEKFRQGKNIEVISKAQSDWLIFDWRQLSWSQNDLKYLIEIYPNFDDSDNIISWTLYTAAFYDIGDKRFYFKKIFEKEVSLEIIAEKAEQLLNGCYNYILKIKISELEEVKF